MKLIASLAAAACVLLGACSARADAPVPLTNVVVTVYGEESHAIVHARGELFLFEEDGSATLWYGDGETPGGRPVDTHLPISDVYHWEDDVHANSHSLVLNPEFDIRATANSLDIRFEGSTVLRIVGNTNGCYVPYSYSYQPEGSTFAISSALVEDAALTLLYSTNLTSVPNFREVPDELATVTTNNGVVSWVVSADALMAPSGANICMFSVRASTSFSTGIYATAPIVAEQGIEMSGERWDAWPDIGAIATNAADAAVAPVAGDLADHTSATNPHGITAAGIGALTSETDSTALGALNIASNALNSKFSKYLPLSGGTVTGGVEFTNRVTIGSRGAGDLGSRSFTSGYLNTASAQDSQAFGYNTKATMSYAHSEGYKGTASGLGAHVEGGFYEKVNNVDVLWTNLASGSASHAEGARTVASGRASHASGVDAKATHNYSHSWSGVPGSSSSAYNSHAVGSWNINPDGGLTNMWVGNTNMASHITSLALPLTGGVIRGNLVITNTSDAVGGRFAHGKGAVASGAYATAEGENATASGMYSYAWGKNVTASGYGGRVVGANSQALQSWSTSAGLNAEAAHERSYVWNANSANKYSSKGAGTWCINPDGGPNGVYIGQSNLTQIINAAVAAWMEANGY